MLLNNTFRVKILAAFGLMIIGTFSVYAATLGEIKSEVSADIATYFPASNVYVLNPTADGFPPKANAFPSPVGGAAAVGTAPDDLEYAKAKNRILENVPIDKLPPGIYTFVIAADGTVRYGAAVNIWEVGTKHLHLGLGLKYIVSAGEIDVDSRGAEVRLASGTYMSKVSPEDQKAVALSTQKFLQSKVTTKSFRVLKGQSADTFILRSSVPSPSELKNLCQPESPFLAVEDEKIKDNRKTICVKPLLKSYMNR